MVFRFEKLVDANREVRWLIADLIASNDDPIVLDSLFTAKGEVSHSRSQVDHFLSTIDWSGMEGIEPLFPLITRSLGLVSFSTNGPRIVQNLREAGLLN